VEEVLKNPAIDLVFITTRHDSHAELTCQALHARKHVWVEKPLALSLAELRQVCQALDENPACRLVVGFNRPFSRSATWLFQKLGSPTQPPAQSPPHPITTRTLMLLYRVNAGYVLPDSWVHDPRLGGGCLVGEGCHFFDFLRCAANSRAESVHTEAAATDRVDLPATANFAATVRFLNGSVAQLLYTSQGAPGVGKEHFECFTGATCGVIDDFHTADFYDREHHQRCPRHAQDKGQAELVDSFIKTLREGAPPPMRPEDVLESSLLTLAAQQSLITHCPVQLPGLRKHLL
jgi:polar amino acid transport system substrate-binding protein